MVEDEDYRHHPLAAGALRQLADNYAKQKDDDQALRYWKQTVADFSATNRNEANRARSNLISHYIRSRDYASYEAWRVDPERRDDAEHRVDVVDDLMGTGIHRFRYDWRYSQFQQDQKKKDLAAFYEYLTGRKDWYAKAERLWEYYTRALWIASELMRDRAATQEVVSEALAFVEKTEDDGKRNERVAWMIDRLRSAGDYVRARHCLGKLTDAHLAAYKDYEISGHGENDWKQAAARLLDLEKMGDAEWTARARRARAWVYKDRLRRYEDAVALYRQINEPPNTLWSIQDAYVRWGKLEEALTTLSEIENFFPDEAPNAAWHKAHYLHEAGDRKRTIAAARRVLAVYPKSQASSKAHQLLEEYGIRTGGGVLEE